MENNEAIAQFLRVANFIQSLSPRDRNKFDEIEIVLMDIVNNKPKHRRTYTISEAIWGTFDGGIPIGIIMLKWGKPEDMVSRLLPDGPKEAIELLAHSLAEAQDEQSVMTSEDDDDD